MALFYHNVIRIKFFRKCKGNHIRPKLIFCKFNISSLTALLKEQMKRLTKEKSPAGVKMQYIIVKK